MKIDIIDPPKPEPQIVLTLTADEAALVATAVSGHVEHPGYDGVRRAFRDFNGKEEFFGADIKNVDTDSVDLCYIFTNLMDAVRGIKNNV